LNVAHVPNSRESDGLSALVLYLRPTVRAELVGNLVKSGLFVREQDVLEADAADEASTDGADLVIVCMEGTSSHRSLMSRIAQSGRIVIAVLPAMSSALSVTEGAFAVVRGDENAAGLSQVLGAAGKEARIRRLGSAIRGLRQPLIFGRLHYRESNPWLSSERELTSLSPTEHGVLNALVARLGSVVTKAELCARLAGEDEPASDAYLKTVILRIRRKAARLGGDPTRLVAVRGAGYVLRS
jgi:hypothetical protein